MTNNITIEFRKIKQPSILYKVNCFSLFRLRSPKRKSVRFLVFILLKISLFNSSFHSSFGFRFFRTFFFRSDLISICSVHKNSNKSKHNNSQRNLKLTFHQFVQKKSEDILLGEVIIMSTSKIPYRIMITIVKTH